MKYFTEPTGLFVLKIPIEWQYKNIIFGYEDKSPFSFELYENPIGVFQISCFPADGKYDQYPKQKADKQNLNFVSKTINDSKYKCKAWFCRVEDYCFLAKYIYDANMENSEEIIFELTKVHQTLSTVVLVSEKNRKRVFELDKYDKFIGALSASFDLRNAASFNNSMIELIIIIAAQIDAYLRLAIVLNFQLENKSDDWEIKYLYQGENDTPISERKIYKDAYKSNIITENQFIELERLYNLRNKIVHRFIISEFKTKDIIDVSKCYEEICEEIRLVLKKLEDEQSNQSIGIYANKGNVSFDELSDEIKEIYSRINDKHLLGVIER